MTRRVTLLLAATLTGAMACDNAAEPVEALYTIEVTGEQFRIRVTDAQTAARLDERMRTGTTGVILGRVATGNAG